MNDEITLFIARPAAPAKDWCIIAPSALAQKEIALSASALIGRVTNGPENAQAVASMRALKGLSSAFERERKVLKEPLLEAGRMLDKLVAAQRDELQRELGRLEVLVRDFALEEQRRVREESESAQAAGVMDAPIPTPTRAPGQALRRNMAIKQIDSLQLMRARPDLVRRVEFDMLAIKEILNRGEKLPGVVAEEDFTVSVRGDRPKMIDV